MLTTKYWIPQNPDSSMLCEVKGRKFLKYVGNKTFFNLFYPFFLGHGHCSMSFWPFKSVGSTKGQGEYKRRRRDSWYCDQCFLLSHLFALLIYVPVRYSVAKPFQRALLLKVLKIFLKSRITRTLRIPASLREMSTWKTPLITSMNFSVRHHSGSWYHTNEVPIWEHIYLIGKLIF